MKKLKKLFAVILSLAMVLGMSMTTFATGTTQKTANITVSGLATRIDAVNDQGFAEERDRTTDEAIKVQYVRIIKAVDSTEKGWHWEFDNGVQGQSDIGMTLDQIIEKADPNKTSGGDTDFALTGTINPNITGLNFSTLNSKLGTGKVDNDLDGEVTIENVEAGLYAIRAIDPTNEYVYSWMLAFVGYDYNNIVNGSASLKDATVTAKGAKDKTDKSINGIDKNDNSTVNDNKSVTNDDTVSYTVTQTYPLYTVGTNEQKVFTITDTLTNGYYDEQNFNLSIKIGDTTYTMSDSGTNENSKFGFNWIGTSNKKTSFTINLGGQYYDISKAGANVEISYSAKVDITTIDNPLKNDVTTTKTNPDGTPKTTYSRVINPVVSAEIVKVDAGEGNKVLSGAKFQLYTDLGSGTKPEGADGIYTPASGSEKAKIGEIKDSLSEGESWVKKVGDEVTTEADGKAKFHDLDAQRTYYVVETDAPEGYSLNTEAYKLTGSTTSIDYEKKLVTDSDGKEVWETKYSATDFNSLNGNGNANFPNTKLSSLPSTGGIGTTIFTIGGCAIMIIAAALFFASRRKSSDAK